MERAPLAADPSPPLHSVLRRDSRLNGAGQWATFRTRQLGDSPEVTRTFGCVMRVGVGGESLPLELTGDRPNLPGPSGNCAYGKIAVLSRSESRCEAACYQVSDCGQQVQLIACGNALAAAAALDLNHTGERDAAIFMQLPGECLIEVVVEAGAQPFSVRQTWLDVPPLIPEVATVGGRRCAVLISPLNHYLLIEAGPHESVHDFSLSEAIAHWNHFGLERQPLISRMAVVPSQAAHRPDVKFFTCGQRMHPSAPLTGLAVLAVASDRLDWPGLRNIQRVNTPAGSLTLPRIRPRPGGAYDIEFSDILVDLNFEFASSGAREEQHEAEPARSHADHLCGIESH